MASMVEVKDLNMNFYTMDGELQVLKDVNFTVEEGEILALLGPSGSGKSTLLNILTKLLKPTSGDVEIKGKIGYMFQRDHLLEWRTIMDNITIALEIQKKLTDEAKEKIESLLKAYDLWDFRNRYPRELSGGMRQRVALIRTLSINPDILLLDEPFSALDYQTRILVSDDITKIIKRERKTTILVTHDISEAISMGDKVAVLSKRPAKIKSTYDIELTLNEEKTPLSARKAPEFKDYFDLLWKDLDVYNKEEKNEG
ncbi:NitT/TauT family transport system ATP-binding protein [Clostridium collagenovorans DSM 3089]|uniref:NitT/TauT family transport system ATP-binding protein n=1 Tax=Clostridium collagenovorans DSM 3089 TaxID=1121306 RepID=A0A1M5T874_9CLOT|nr:ABC transporter ATP-binding protein [Clostridium collagenovorans]SHH46922.1 NitT/TauT family transport system ATP-binding protein [Clostridium collagenovorans DSM 3089]